MRRLSFFVLLFFVGVNNLIRANNIEKDSSLTILPANRIYPVIFLDPIECQSNGGSYFLSHEGKGISLYSTVNLGFTKPVIAHNGKFFSWEINFGTAIFTQFDLNRKDDGTYLAGLLNSDFKISTDFSLKRNNNLLKLKVFHLSSHLGDDYMLRNPAEINDKSENYEQIDITYLRLRGENYWYAGIGEIYTKYVFRKRFSMMAGGLLNFGETKPVNFFSSVNIKMLAENNLVPDFRGALGVTFNRESQSMIRFWLEYYNGQLPYSTINYGRVDWVGLAMAINLK